MSVDNAEDTGAGVEESAPARRIAIVGFAEGHRQMAPFDDPSWEMWGMNRLHAVMPDKRWDAWFDLHPLDRFYLGPNGERDEEHIAFLKAFAGPVYVRAEDLGLALEWGIVNAVPFPRHELEQRFGFYMTNTVSWLLALAITTDPNVIGVYGVDMAQDTLQNAEYSAQRPSCEYFLGIAAGMGIEIILPSHSDLLRTVEQYGWEDNDFLREKTIGRMQELGMRKENFKQQLAQEEAAVNQGRANWERRRIELISAINQLDGALQECTYLLKNHMPPLPAVHRPPTEEP